MRRWLGAAAVALAAVGLTPGVAAAASGRITQIEPDGATLRLVFAADSLPEGVTLDPASVFVTVNGTKIEAKAEPVTGAAVARSAELVIDTSGSMRGEGMAAAKSAALAFVDAVPADVKIGLVTFADTATVKVRPTTDRAAVRRAVGALQPTGETSLYDGVLLGLRELGSTGVRTLLVLSDGADTRSKAPLGSVLNAAKKSGAAVDTVAFKTPDATGQVLAQVADAGGGRSVAAAKAGDIGAAFRESARALSNQLTVTATLPAALKGAVTVAVTATAGAETLTDEALTTVDATVALPSATAAPYRVEVGPLASRPVLYGALAGLFLALALVFAMAFGGLGGDREQGRVRRRLSLYTLTGRNLPQETVPTALGDNDVARSAVELADRVVRQGGFESSLARKLERAGSAIKPAEWLLIHAGSGFGLGLLLLLLTGAAPVLTVLGLVLGFTLPPLYLAFRASRRTNAFLTQLPDTLQLLAGSLSAGYSLPQAVDAVVREGAQPIAGEFSRAIVESRLGVPIEDALETIAHRMDSRDFHWVVMAIRIQREVGGNLAEVLNNVAGTMRERERVRRQVRVLSAEGRLSAWILGGLPPLFGLYLLTVRGSYINPLFTDPIGLLLLGVAALLFTVGVFWLRKVVRVEV
ncbi:MAG TPA: type II secretion system F family protein [Frankiaceae bacterium]|nr:type II secretion system F family protein [Frankiaceae bacterium]